MATRWKLAEPLERRPPTKIQSKPATPLTEARRPQPAALARLAPAVPRALAQEPERHGGESESRATTSFSPPSQGENNDRKRSRPSQPRGQRQPSGAGPPRGR